MEDKKRELSNFHEFIWQVNKWKSLRAICMTWSKNLLHIVPLKTKPVRVTATSSLNRLKSEVGTQIMEYYYIEVMTFRRVINFRKYLDDSHKLDWIPFLHCCQIINSPWQTDVKEVAFCSRAVSVTWWYLNRIVIILPFIVWTHNWTLFWQAILDIWALGH